MGIPDPLQTGSTRKRGGWGMYVEKPKDYPNKPGGLMDAVSHGMLIEYLANQWPTKEDARDEYEEMEENDNRERPEIFK